MYTYTHMWYIRRTLPIYVVASLVDPLHEFIVRNISLKAYLWLNSVSIALCILLLFRRMFSVFSASFMLVVWT